MGMYGAVFWYNPNIRKASLIEGGSPCFYPKGAVTAFTTSC